jgi:hypothetical protein
MQSDEMQEEEKEEEEGSSDPRFTFEREGLEKSSAIIVEIIMS